MPRRRPVRATRTPAAPSTRPAWLAFEPRAELPLCPCVEGADGRTYARAACPHCHGAGVLTAEALDGATREALRATTPQRTTPAVMHVADALASRKAGAR